MNTFESELREMIARYRDQIGVVLADLVDALETEVEKLVDEVNANGVMPA